MDRAAPAVPATVLNRVHCPVLAVTGGKDVQVSATENLTAIEEALRQGGNRAYRVLEFPDLGHLFQRGGTGLPEEYLAIREGMAPEALEVIGDWILQVTAGLQP